MLFRCDEEVGGGSIAEALLRYEYAFGVLVIALGNLWSHRNLPLAVIKKADNFCCLPKLFTNEIQNPPYGAVLCIQELLLHRLHI